MWSELTSVLEDRNLSRRERFTRTIERAFEVQREADALHTALRRAGVAVLESPGFDGLGQRVVEVIANLIEGGDGVDAAERARYVLLVVTSLLERVGREPLEDEQAARLAGDTARMLAEFLEL